MNKLFPNLYLDIGNTNIKYCFDDDKIYIVDSNLYELSYIFDKYLHNHNIYLINVNFELNKFIKENTNKNLFIFDKEKYHNEFNWWWYLLYDKFFNWIKFVKLFVG